ncbi:MAG TPA: GNAT family N-acetyltransferase [Rhizomicrobium sp.]
MTVYQLVHRTYGPARNKVGDMANFSIRAARQGDEGLVLTLLRELADYEKLLDRFHITEEIIGRDYFGERPMLNCDLAFEGDAPVGIATWYWTYHSFAARRGIFLEDLFVRPQTRGKGYGKALLSHLARNAIDGRGGQVEWEVLDWNQPSIEFYEGIGARRQGGWHTYRLEGDALKKMAS